MDNVINLVVDTNWNNVSEVFSTTSGTVREPNKS